MIEPIMYFGIGFLLASLFALVLLPLVHNRATRLTVRRLEAATPVSMAEIQADKDQLRAEFAMSTRRLEMSVDQLKTRTTTQLAELGKKTEVVIRLKGELGEKTAAILALESREKSLRDQIRVTEEELAVKTNAIHEATRALSDKEAELAKLAAELGERTFYSDSQRVEIVALRTQVEALKAQIDRFESDVRNTEDRLTRERTAADAAAKEVSAEHGRVENLGNRVGLLETQLFAQTTEAEILARRAHDLEERLGEQGRLLAESEYEASHLRSELENARRIETDLSAELAALEERHAAATMSLRAEKAIAENELARTGEERAKLQREVAAMKREAEATWAAERVENALLRERINDIATEVTRLTLVLEGPGSPIETILAGEATDRRAEAGTVNGKSAPGGLTREPAEGSLADRIRALQTRASRVSPAT